MALVQNKVVQEVQRFADDERQWTLEHDATVKCRTLEYRLARAVAIYDWIVKIDEIWRLSVLRGNEPYDAATHDLLQSAFRLWHQASARLLADLTEIQQQGFEIQQADAYRIRLREAEAALTDDARFFADDALVRLRDDAIDAHERGDTLEYRTAER